MITKFEFFEKKLCGKSNKEPLTKAVDKNSTPITSEPIPNPDVKLKKKKKNGKI